MVTQAVNSTLNGKPGADDDHRQGDLKLSGTEAGTIYTFDEVRREFRSRARPPGSTGRGSPPCGIERVAAGETAVGRATAQRFTIQIPACLRR